MLEHYKFTIFYHFLQGLKYKYPLCCIIHFCWDDFLDPTRHTAEYRGCMGCLSEYVHCNLHHLIIKLRRLLK